jgi:hypothetical protein
MRDYARSKDHGIGASRPAETAEASLSGVRAAEPRVLGLAPSIVAAMLGEFFLCRRDRLDGELLASGPQERVRCVSAKGMTPVNIASLGQILDAGTYDDILESCGDEHYEADSGESGVWDVPAAVCNALLASNDVEAVSEKWVATEELQLDGWRASDGLSVLKQLAEVLRQQDEGKVLWYWWSL